MTCKTSNLDEKKHWVLKRILEFYSDPCNLEKFFEIMKSKKEKKISLRLINWFVTNYSKKNNIVYPISRPNGDMDIFMPYLRYKNLVSSYPKKLFDPFCRSEDIIQLELNDQTIDTAICQLHFFKWAIENLVMEFIEKNADAIYEDMEKNDSRPNKNPIKKTKQQLSQSIYQKMVCFNNPINIPFYKTK